jgi:hypothetical protein
MPKKIVKPKSKATKKPKSKANDKNKIDIRININSKKDDIVRKKTDKKGQSYKSYSQRSSNRGTANSSNKEVIQQPSQSSFHNPIVHIQPVNPLQNNTSLLDNQYGLGVARQLTAIEGDMTRMKADRDMAIQTIQNEKVERENFTNSLNNRINELMKPILIHDLETSSFNSKEPSPFTQQSKHPMESNNEYRQTIPYTINLGFDDISEVSDDKTNNTFKVRNKPNKKKSEVERLKENFNASHTTTKNSKRKPISKKT